MPTDLDRLGGAIGYLLAHGMNSMAAEVQNAIAELTELRSRPAIPPWSRERPTEPGWYWRRANGDEFVTEVENHGYDGRLAYQCGWYVDRSGGGAQWAWTDPEDDDLAGWSGPLSMPPEPEPKGAES